MAAKRLFTGLRRSECQAVITYLTRMLAYNTKKGAALQVPYMTAQQVTDSNTMLADCNSILSLRRNR